MNDKNARNRIIETSIRMIKEKDYNKITTNHIAKKTGVSIGTLYYHFKNGKPDIVKEIVRQGYAEFLDEVILSSLTMEKLPEFLNSFLKRYLEQHKENKSLLVAIEIASLSNRKAFQDFEYIQSELNLVPLISSILKQLGYSDREDLNGISKFLLYSIDSIIHRHVICENLVIKDEELVKHLAEMVLRFIKYSAE
jgi:AcrR family transcriptional regulator